LKDAMLTSCPLVRTIGPGSDTGASWAVCTMSRMRYEVKLREWERHPGRGYSGYFAIEQAGTHYRVLRVILRDMVLELVYTNFPRADGGAMSPALVRTMNRYAVRTIEAALRAGAIEPDAGGEMHVLEAPGDDETVGVLMGLAGDKECAYQESEGRDLYCIAASEEDQTATRFTTNGRRIAPTSRPLCAGCHLPDTDYICSHFLHPGVIGVDSDSGVIRREVVKGLCDLAQSEFARKQDCHAGANGCWERIVEIQAPAVEVVPVQAVERALDDLDVRWRLAFENRHVVRLPGAADVSVLALRCSSRDEFERRLSVLADIMKRLDVPDDLFPPGTELPEATHTHRRLELLFESKLAGEELDQVKGAISTLRRINMLRAGGQHGGEAAKDRARAADALGVPLDERWDDAWERVRALTARALRDIGEAVRRVADSV